MSETIFKGGIDIGNKNYKVSIDEKEKFEFPIAYLQIDEDTFINEHSGEGTKKVKYNGNYYLVGLHCNRMLPRNKSAENFREVAQMIKLTGLAEFLKRMKLQEGTFKLVTGTPLADYDEYKNGYKDYLIDKEKETIEVDGESYSIKVKDAFITKQCGAVAPTISNWKSKEHLILVDLGGGTADIAYFNKGNVARYMTIDFPLNTIMENLGNYLNSLGLGLGRPNEADSGFLHTIENVIKDGTYLGISALEYNGNLTSLSDIINEWLQVEVDKLIEDISLRLNLSDPVKNTAEVYYFAGGTLLLKDVLVANTTFKNKTILVDPEYANVKAFDLLAQIREWQ